MDERQITVLNPKRQDPVATAPPPHFAPIVHPHLKPAGHAETNEKYEKVAVVRQITREVQTTGVCFLPLGAS